MSGGGAPSRAQHLQAFLNNSLAIRQEIQRFESVHPSIYAIYDLIELIPDQQVAQQIRDHVVCIEGESIFIYKSILTGTKRIYVPREIRYPLSGHIIRNKDKRAAC